MSKRRKENESSEEDDYSSDEDSSDIDSNLEIQVEFDAQSISEHDYHGIRRLLQQLFTKAPINLSDLADYIMKQKDVGTVIKKTSELVKLQEYLVSMCLRHGTAPQHSQLVSILETHRVGVVLHERFINIPPAIGPPLLSNLVEELDAMDEDRQPTHLLFITRSHDTPAVMGKGGRGKKKPKVTSTKDLELMLEFLDMEYMQKNNFLSYSYPVDTDTLQPGKWRPKYRREDFDELMKPYRTVFVLTKTQFIENVKKLVHAFDETGQ